MIAIHRRYLLRRFCLLFSTQHSWPSTLQGIPYLLSTTTLIAMAASRRQLVMSYYEESRQTFLVPCRRLSNSDVWLKFRSRSSSDIRSDIVMPCDSYLDSSKYGMDSAMIQPIPIALAYLRRQRRSFVTPSSKQVQIRCILLYQRLFLGLAYVLSSTLYICLILLYQNYCQRARCWNFPVAWNANPYDISSRLVSVPPLNKGSLPADLISDRSLFASKRRCDGSTLGGDDGAKICLKGRMGQQGSVGLSAGMAPMGPDSRDLQGWF
ncbi:hypothetical protein KCU66_g29, partial [Aureobasidium melanogenum]